MKKEEEKDAAFKAELAETVEVVAEYVRPYADRYMRELGFIASFISKNYTDVIPSDILNEFGIIPFGLVNLCFCETINRI